MLLDVRHAVRALLGATSFTCVSLLVLTLGIGASTAIFSVVDAVVLRGLPFADAHRVVVVSTRNVKTGSLYRLNAPQDFLDWRARQDVFSGLAAMASGLGVSVDSNGRPEELRVMRVTADFFQVLTATPRVGRSFRTDQGLDEDHSAVIISDGLWRRYFGADPNVIGRTIRLDSDAREIIGVMPRGFDYPVGQVESTDIWMPLMFPPAHRERGTTRTYYIEQIIARLRDGISTDQADVRMRVITADLAKEHPTWFTNRVAAVRPLHDVLIGGVRRWMWMLLSAVSLVMLIACLNIANLVLARWTARGREISVRIALGARRWQIARGLLVESLLLSTVGTALGLLVSWWGVSVLKASLPQTLPRLGDIAIDRRVLLAATAAAVVTGILFGLLPAVRLSKPSLSEELREGGHTTAGRKNQLLRSMLVVAEVALAVPLLVGAGLFVSSFLRIARIDLGLDYRSVLTVGVWPSVNFSDPSDAKQLAERMKVALPAIIERIGGVPDVESVGFVVGGLPLSGNAITSAVRVPGRADPFKGEDAADIRHVTPGYIDATRIPLIQGRYISDDDTANADRVVVLNQEAARRYLSDRNPIGATLDIDGERTVVGVVGNVRVRGPEQQPRPEAYMPASESTIYGGDFVIRAVADTQAIIPAVKEAIWQSLPDTPVRNVITLETLLGRLLAQRRFSMLLVGLLGVLAITIAAVGIYGVMAYTVTQRAPEISLRMALGAPRERVLGMILSKASMLLGVGLIIGIAGAWLLAGLVKSFLFEVDPRDATVFGVSAAVLFACGLLAALLPALRASRIDPIVALAGRR